MADFEVVPGALRMSAEAAGVAAGEVRAVDLMVVARLAVALPGSRTAGLVGDLGAHWERDTTAWASKMGSYGENLVASAQGYELADEAAQRVFEGL